ncbi:exonuclease SbcCD subunit D [Enterococcus hirae]|nr:exonuclease SbcCD subunit D [Enterococcus hirae]
MKLLHTSDWHIGKQIKGYPLLPAQEDAFEELRKIAKEEQVDGIIIAGDLFDRAIPPVEAVEAADDMLRRLNLEDGFPLYIVSGNHDGAERLHFATEWMKAHELHLVTKLRDAFIPVETPEVQLFFLPFFDPLDARIYYGETSEKMRTITQALERILPEMIERFDPAKKHLLITHFHVTGSRNEDFERTSETPSTVGGLLGVPQQMFADFDYVALGHLHTRRASPSARIRYSGSLVKYNTLEIGQEKGVSLIETQPDGFSERFIPLKETFPWIKLRGTLETLRDPDFYRQYPRGGQAFYQIELTEAPHVNGVNHLLQHIYGQVVEIRYPQQTGQTHDPLFSQPQQKLPPEEQVAAFFEKVTEQPLSEKQRKLVQESLIKIEKELEE